MEWNIKDSTLECAFSSIGSMQDDTYVAGTDVLAILEEIHRKLSYEDQTLRTFRRSIGFNDNIKNDLIPLLINIKDGIIIEATIRILVNLTIPIECLFTIELMNRTDVGRQTVYELNHLLIKSKECFMDIRAVRAIVDHMKSILEKDFKLSLNQCESINNCLLLLRNILHIPELNTTEYFSHQQQRTDNNNNYSSFSISENDHINNNYNNNQPSFYQNVNINNSNNNNNNNNNNYKNGTIISMQNQILWNLFTLSIDKLLIHLMSCPQKSIWGKTMVQLIAVMYKDQHITTLQKLLNVWFVEASLSDSSEDFESNTSPQKVDSGDSSPMLTSDPTSDSSDNGGNNNNKNNNNPHGNNSSSDECQQMINTLNRSKETKLDIPIKTKDKSKRKDVGIITNNSNNKNNRRASNEELKLNNQYFNEHKCSKFNFDDNKMKHNNTIISSNNKLIKNNNNNYNNNKNLKFSEDKIDSQKSSNSTIPTNQNSTKNKQHYNNNNTNYMPSSIINNAGIGNNPMLMRNGGSENLELPSSQSELSDCGYGTQVENNQESISTSSNDDDDDDDHAVRPSQKVHQKPPSYNQKQRYNAVNHPRSAITIQDKKDLRRKKLVKRNRSTVINMKGLLHHHIPTDEDITNILKEFTVDFLLKGYGYLVQDLHAQLLYESDGNNQIDKSHFFWLITFFLKFASQLELDFEHVRFVLSFDIVSYLTYEGVSLCEQLEMIIHQKGLDLTPYLRRIHLVVTAIREILQAIDTYQKQYSYLSEQDKLQIQALQYQMSATEDLRCLFILLLRQYNPNVQSKQYLQDLIITNHNLLLFLDGTSKFSEYKGKMAKHIEQFATVEIMFHYGLLLEDFKENGEFVNDCIFTMMHHIGGDLGKVSTLFQPIILKTYSQIWETGYELCDDWSDLIEYVIHKFMNTPQQTPLINLPDFNVILPSANVKATISEIWTEDDKNSLHWYYEQSKMSPDVSGKISELFIEYGHKLKPRIAIIEQLLQQDIITILEYDDLMKFENVYYERYIETTTTGLHDHPEVIPIVTESTKNISTTEIIQRPIDDIQNLKENLIKANKGKFLLWLQKLLIECCFVKLTINHQMSKQNINNENFKPSDTIIFEPIPLHFIIKKQSIPIVPWNTEQNSILTYEPFMLLLHKLGFHLPADTGKVFIRIPDFWTDDILFNVAEKLGTIDKSILKFDIKLLSGHHHDGLSDNNNIIIKCSSNLHSELFAIPGCKNTNSIIRYTPNPSSPRYARNWLKFVMNNDVGIDSKNSPTSTNLKAMVNTISANSIQSTISTPIPIISTIPIIPTIPIISTIPIIPTISTIPSIIPIIQTTIPITISPIILTETTIIDNKSTIITCKNSSIPKCQRNITNQIFTNHNEKASTSIKVNNFNNNNNNNKLCKVKVHNCLPNTIVSNQICPSSIIKSNNEIIIKTSSSSAFQSDFVNTDIVNNNNNNLNEFDLMNKQTPKNNDNNNNNNNSNQIDYNNCNRRIYNDKSIDTESIIDRNLKLNGKIITDHNHRTSIEIIDEENENDIISNYETASVASDLTRMYVSDEDEKPDI